MLYFIIDRTKLHTFSHPSKLICKTCSVTDELLYIGYIMSREASVSLQHFLLLQHYSKEIALFSGPHHCLQYGKRGRGWHFSHMSMT